MHVVRARRALAHSSSESAEGGDGAPTSDAPVTLAIVGDPNSSARPALAARTRLDSYGEPTYLEGFRVARATVALGLVAIGVVTAVVIELPRGERSRPAARPPLATVAPAPTVAPPTATAMAPDEPRPILASTPNTAPSAALSASAASRPKAKTPRRKPGMTRKPERP
jgi:hypothetical protein